MINDLSVKLSNHPQIKGWPSVKYINRVQYEKLNHCFLYLNIKLCCLFYCYVRGMGHEKVSCSILAGVVGSCWDQKVPPAGALVVTLDTNCSQVLLIIQITSHEPRLAKTGLKVFVVPKDSLPGVNAAKPSFRLTSINPECLQWTTKFLTPVFAGCGSNYYLSLHLHHLTDNYAQSWQKHCWPCWTFWLLSGGNLQIAGLAFGWCEGLKGLKSGRSF